MFYTDEKLHKYALPLSQTEKENCESTIHVVTDLLLKFGLTFTRKPEITKNDDIFDYGYSMSFNNETFTIMLQGSYGNGTGIRQESDVDIALICETVWSGNYVNFTASDYGFVDASFSILDFKKKLVAFIDSCYPRMVKAGNKCIDFSGNGTSRKNVDLVPSIRYRDYSKDYLKDKNNFVSGICIKTDDGQSIVNYPEQTRANNIEKNKATSYYYKKLVRIIKRIKSDMSENGFQLADKISSFEIESVVYNVPNNILAGTYNSTKVRVKSVIDYLVNNSNSCSSYTEPNEILKIFDNHKNSITDYQKFIVQLKGFIE